MNGEIFFHENNCVHQRIPLVHTQCTQLKHAITICFPTYSGVKMDEVFLMKTYYMKIK